MRNKYILFAWDHYEANGGAADMIAGFYSPDNAMVHFGQLPFDSANILNLETMKIEYFFHSGKKKWIKGSEEQAYNDKFIEA